MNAKLQAIADDFEKSKEALESYGYKLVTWSEFLLATDRPDNLLTRAMEIIKNNSAPTGESVIYDPEDDVDGWLLIGKREDIARETVFNIANSEPPEGLLSPKELQ